VALLAAAGCEARNQFVPPPPREVTVATPVQREVTDFVQFTGSTRSSVRVDLRARANGYLKQIEFEDGQAVKAGELLFVIEPAPYEAELASAQANLQKAQAAYQLAEADSARIAELVRRNVTTQQDEDTQKAQMATAVAEVAAAKASLMKAELNLSYTRIHAPVSGKISKHLVDVGNLVQAEQTLLATIESVAPIHAYFYPSERELLRFMKMVRQDELRNPDENPPTLFLGLENEEGYPHEGYLDYRELGVDPTTGTVERRGVFPNTDQVLIPGLFVRIRAPIGDPVPRLLVEERAIGSDQRGEFVLVVNKDNVVEYRPVTLGIAVDGMRVIEQGVTSADRIVVNGVQRAIPGSKVVPKLVESRPEGTPPSTDPDAKGPSGTAKETSSTPDRRAQNAPAASSNTPN
jgi:RND family efflux transporter MFP subunit